MTDKKASKNLRKLIAYLGGVTLAAKDLGMTQPQLSYHKNKPLDNNFDRLPVLYAVRAERVTDGCFKAIDLAQVTYPKIIDNPR